MLRKVFLQTQFGTPHAWTDKYLENFRMLERSGWYLKVFTPNDLPSSSNVEIVKMTLEEFDELLGERTGVRANNRLDGHAPRKVVSDYYPAYGQIFQKYIEDFDFWGHTNWDMVYGRLDRYVDFDELKNCDIWSDDINAINGIFCLYRNDGKVNNLFRQVPNWKFMFETSQPTGFDEVHMSRTVREIAGRCEVRFKFPRFFPNHSYDRLIQHQPKPNLYFEKDGSLIERFEDPAAANNHELFPKGHFGREIMMFHFSRTKRWPIQ